MKNSFKLLYKLFNLIFKNRYPVGFKLILDFLSLAIIFYLTNQVVILSIVNNNFTSNLIFPFISVSILYILNVYNSKFRYLNINDILRMKINFELYPSEIQKTIQKFSKEQFLIGFKQYLFNC